MGFVAYVPCRAPEKIPGPPANPAMEDGADVTKALTAGAAVASSRTVRTALSLMVVLA